MFPHNYGTLVQVAPPDRFLEVGSAGHAEQTALILTRVEAVLQEITPRAVVVIGDFCKTQGSCFYFSQSIPENLKKNIVLDLTADSTCIGPTPSGVPVTQAVLGSPSNW